ncbi:MAG: HAMP domain-containing protein [Caldilineaceae bacterium]|nr:HAMP domain-containing protein [Caldilineaceae bacterium]
MNGILLTTSSLPQPRRLGLPWRFLLGVVAVLLITMGIFMLVMNPPVQDARAMLIFLSITAAGSLVVGFGAYRLGLFNQSPRLIWTLISGYVLGGILTFINVWFTATLMFINQHDLQLAAVLLFFATGIAISLGYFVSTAVTDNIKALNQGANAISAGNLQARVDTHGRDEMAQLARSFNMMARQLEEAARKKAEVEKMRRDLIAWVGHDLRTPLASVRAILEALADGVVEDQATVDRYLRTAKRDIGSLTILLDDLFALAQMDAGGLRLDKQPNSLSDLISDTLEGFSKPAIEKGIELSGQVLPGLDPVVLDARHIERVLANLVGNAIRYSPSGAKVQVQARAVGNEVEVSVTDTGDGIPASDLPHIFEQFYRGEKSRSRATGGSGLGLAIAKGIVEAHGGQIKVSSQVGKGTQFTFALPRGNHRGRANPLVRR